MSDVLGVYVLPSEQIECLREVARDALMGAARRVFGLETSSERDQFDHVMTLQRLTLLVHQLGDPGAPPHQPGGVVVDLEQLADLRQAAEEALEGGAARAWRHAALSEWRGLTEHDLWAAEYLAARVADAQRAVDVLESLPLQGMRRA